VEYEGEDYYEPIVNDIRALDPFTLDEKVLISKDNVPTNTSYIYLSEDKTKMIFKTYFEPIKTTEYDFATEEFSD